MSHGTAIPTHSIANKEQQHDYLLKNISTSRLLCLCLYAQRKNNFYQR